MKRPGIPSIQALRWIAATLVVVGHAQQEVVKIFSRHHDIFKPVAFVDFGIGVDIFFIISGFLMYYVAGDEFGLRGAPWLFIKRRFVRIVPLYWLTTTLMLAAILIVPSLLNHNQLDPVHVLMSYLMIAWPNPGGDVFPLLALGWTLNFEVYFYVVFACALFLPRKAGLWISSLFFLATTLFEYFYSGSRWLPDFYGQPIVLEFVLGQLLAILYIEGFRLTSSASIVIGVLAILVHLATRNLIPFPGRLIENGFPAMLLFMSWVFRVCSTVGTGIGRLGERMGDSSYALYLTHPFSLNLLSEVMGRAGVSSPATVISISTIGALGVGIIVFQRIERPLVRLVKNYVFPTRSHAVPESADA